MEAVGTTVEAEEVVEEVVEEVEDVKPMDEKELLIIKAK